MNLEGPVIKAGKNQIEFVVRYQMVYETIFESIQ